MSARWSLALAVPTIVVLTGEPTLWAATGGRYIEGAVVAVDREGGSKPVEGVTIWIEGRGDTTTSRAATVKSNTTVSHRRGEFRLYCPEAYRAGNVVPVRIEKKGYRLQEGDVRVPAEGDKGPLRLVLVPSGAALGEKEKQAIASDIAARVRE